MPGKIEHAGEPLDFSFLKLQDVNSLRKERPRAGKRKPIEKDEEEEDSKKGENRDLLNGEDKLDGDKPKEHKESLVVRNTSVPQINNILSNFSVSLTASKVGVMGARKQEDGKEEYQRRKEITYYVNALLLNKNELRSISGLYDVLSKHVLYEPDRLQWLNLSYNYLVKIEREILSF